MKKAQIAMEFMMTYGWAIIIVLGAISALAYFGVLDPKAFMPDKTSFQAPIANLDNAVLSISGHTVEVAFQNNKGSPIVIPKTGSFNSAQCINGTIQNVTDTITHAEINGTPIQNGERFIVKWNCTPVSNAKPGDRIIADITFDYSNINTGQKIAQFGTIEGKWK